MLLALAILRVVAGLQVTKPDGSTVWRAGQEGVVQWDSIGAADGPTVDIHLMVGPNNGVSVMELGTNIPVSQKTYQWGVSDHLSSRRDYFIVISQSSDSSGRSPGGAAAQSAASGAVGERFVVVSPRNGPPTNGCGGARIAALIWTALLLVCYMTH